jgi:hypothetical protein
VQLVAELPSASAEVMSISTLASAFSKGGVYAWPGIADTRSFHPDSSSCCLRKLLSARRFGHNLWDATLRGIAALRRSSGAVPEPRLRSFGWFLQLPVWRRGREPRS